MIILERPINNLIVENAQTVDEVVTALAAHKHQIKSIRRNLIFTQYIQSDDNTNAFSSKSYVTKHACFILQSSEDAEQAVYQYINKHCKCFVELADFAKELYSKNPDYEPFGLLVSLGIHPIRLTDHNPLHLNRYYEYSIRGAQGVCQSYYLDLNGRDIKEIANEWKTVVSELVLNEVKAGRLLFFKLIKRAISVSDSAIIVDDKIDIKFDGIYSTGYDEDDSYAIIRIGNERFIAGTDIEMYVILERMSHLIDI